MHGLPMAPGLSTQYLNLLRQTAITGILAVGMVFVIISAEIDLSVGSMMGRFSAARRRL